MKRIAKTKTYELKRISDIDIIIEKQKPNNFKVKSLGINKRQSAFREVGKDRFILDYIHILVCIWYE